MAMSDGSCLVRVQDSKDFVARCLMAVGTKEEHARLHADVLLAGDSSIAFLLLHIRGHFSHGINRLGLYVNDVKGNLCDGNAVPTVLHETASTAHVNGNNGLGSVTGKFCMELAIKKAKETGVAWVAAKHSNHFGIAGFYTEMAMESGLLGWSMTNGSPFVVPTRAKKAALSTNPIAVGVQGEGEGNKFLLDMATSAVAIGKVEVQSRKGEKIPEGWGMDKDGNSTTDPDKVINGGFLMPLGGAEQTSGYKGYGLGLMVDILCGVLAGGTFGPKAKKWMSGEGIGNYCHSFMALDPKRFNPNFDGDLSELLHTIKGLDSAEGPSKPILIPGEPEWQKIAATEGRGGILYPQKVLDMCKGLAEQLGVDPMIVTSS
ncbi:unnamed protein product [Notodromas monacha]|uniref:Malate dehydrogenase n=1 Tax=Notodromas monacha TaxID=399045 RepID=A0A7R9BHG8_9CRUS|nr:unnamed protein product [Notodromas monacha]CAG0914192.1 unnamed protein product [Notodromas monacha]